jgi:hypothetical protein
MSTKLLNPNKRQKTKASPAAATTTNEKNKNANDVVAAADGKPTKQLTFATTKPAATNGGGSGNKRKADDLEPKDALGDVAKGPKGAKGAKGVNNFPRFTVDSMAERLQATKDPQGKFKIETLIKAIPWTTRDGRVVQPRSPFKLDHKVSSEYLDVAFKVSGFYNNGDVPGDWTKLTLKGVFFDPDSCAEDPVAFANAASFGHAFQQLLYDNRNNLPFVWSKGSDVGKNVAGGLKAIAAATNNASYDDIQTLPQHQKYRTETNFETGEESYINTDKEPICLVEDGKPPPDGAIQTGNKYFTSRCKPGHVVFDFNYSKVNAVTDAATGEHMEFSNITTGSVVKFRAQLSLYALSEQKIVGATMKAPVGQNPTLEVLWLNPDGKKINPDQKFQDEASAGGASASSSSYAAERDAEATKQMAAAMAAKMAAKMSGAH